MPSKRRTANTEQEANNLDVPPVDSVQPLDPGISSGLWAPHRHTEIPQNWNAEMMVVATILACPWLLGWIHAQHLDSSHFWFPFPRAVFEAMIRISQYAGSEGITFSAVQCEVERMAGKGSREQFNLLHRFLEIGRISEEVVLSFIQSGRAHV